LPGAFFVPRTGIDVEQTSADQYAIEYCYSPTPDAEERLRIALDLLLPLLADETPDDPSLLEQRATPESVE
jgi:hypothetical protein